MLIYCAGHAGVKGNELTDKFASTAPVAGTITKKIVTKLYKRMLAVDIITA